MAEIDQLDISTPQLGDIVMSEVVMKTGIRSGICIFGTATKVRENDLVVTFKDGLGRERKQHVLHKDTRVVLNNPLG